MAEKKVIDVTDAKDAKVEIGSKPMIVGHTSMAADPMVRTAKAEALEGTPEEPLQEKEQEQKIAPPSEKQKTIEPPVHKEAETQVAAATKAVEPEADEESEEKKATVDPTVIAQEQQERLQKIIDDKKYRVSIKQARHTNKSTLIVFIGLCIALLLGGFYMVDTKRLDVGFELPFTVFGTSETNDSSVDSGNGQTSTAPAVEQVKESAEWLEYATDNFSIKLPDGWQVNNVDGILSILSYDQMVYKPGEKAVVINDKTGNTDAGCCLFIYYGADETALLNYDDETLNFTPTPLILDSGVQAIMYNRVTAEAQDGLEVGTKISDYVIKNDAGENVVIRFVLVPGSEVSTSMLELAVKSVAIK